MMQGYVEGLPPKTPNDPVGKDSQSQTILKTPNALNKSKETIPDTKEMSVKTTEVDSCSKQMTAGNGLKIEDANVMDTEAEKRGHITPVTSVHSFTLPDAQYTTVETEEVGSCSKQMTAGNSLKIEDANAIDKRDHTTAMTSEHLTSPDAKYMTVKTKEFSSCSKQMTTDADLEIEVNVIELEEGKRGHMITMKPERSLFANKSISNVQVLKSPSKDEKDSDLNLDKSSVAYSNSEFSIPSALKVGLHQYSFLDKYSYSYLDAYKTSIETLPQSEIKKPRVQIMINSETEVIKESNIDVQDKSSTALLPHKEKDNTEETKKTRALIVMISETQLNKEFHDSKSSAILLPKEDAEIDKDFLDTVTAEVRKNSDINVEEMMTVQEPQQRNQNDGQTTLLYSQSSVLVQTTDLQNSEQLQNAEESVMIAVSRHSHQLTSLDYQPGQFSHSTVVDINQPLLFDTGQVLSARTSPVKFNQIRHKEQPRRQRNYEVIQGTTQRQEVEETTETPQQQGNSENDGQKAGGNPGSKQPSDNQTPSQMPQKSALKIKDSKLANSEPSAQQRSQEHLGGQTEFERPRQTSQQLSRIHWQSAEEQDSESAVKKDSESAVKQDSTPTKTEEVPEHEKTRSSQNTTEKPTSSNKSTSQTQQMLQNRGVHIRDDESQLPGNQQPSRVEIDSRENIEGRRLSIIKKASPKDSKTDLLPLVTDMNSGQQTMLKDLVKADVPSYAPSYAPAVQQRSGLGTGAAVGLGVGALAAGGLAGYALGGGFSSDSPTEEVHVAEDFGGDSEWMD